MRYHKQTNPYKETLKSKEKEHRLRFLNTGLNLIT